MLRSGIQVLPNINNYCIYIQWTHFRVYPLICFLSLNLQIPKGISLGFCTKYWMLWKTPADSLANSNHGLITQRDSRIKTYDEVYTKIHYTLKTELEINFCTGKHANLPPVYCELQFNPRKYVLLLGFNTRLDNGALMKKLKLRTSSSKRVAI